MSSEPSCVTSVARAVSSLSPLSVEAVAESDVGSTEWSSALRQLRAHWQAPLPSLSPPTPSPSPAISFVVGVAAEDLHAEAVATADAHLHLPVFTVLSQPPLLSGVDGLTPAEAAVRLVRDGPNALPTSRPLPLWLAFLHQLSNLLILLLVASAVVALALGEVVEGVAILVIVLINCSLSVWSEHSANSSLQALLALARPLARVRRDGLDLDVDSHSLVVGDVVLVHTGDVVPADARLLSADALQVSEMHLTGESHPVRKVVEPSPAQQAAALTPPCLLLSGSNVQEGHAVAVVTATGPRSRLGQIAHLILAGEDEARAPAAPALSAWDAAVSQLRARWRRAYGRRARRTALQKQLHRLGLVISGVALLVCGLVFGLGVGRQHRDLESPDEPVWLSMLLVAVSLAVSSIPEGLPLAVTVAFALGSHRLSRRQALVRRIAAVESLGTVTVICSDKTNTLTAGKMAAVRLVAGGHSFHVTRGGLIPDSNDRLTDEQRRCALVTARIAALCNNSRLGIAGSTAADGARLWTGNPTEMALMDFAVGMGLIPAELRRIFTRVLELPFTSERKMMFSIHQLSALWSGSFLSTAFPAPSSLCRVSASVQSSTDQSLLLTCGKGSPDYLLPQCMFYLDAEGELQPMTEEFRTQTLSQVAGMAQDSLRVLGLVYKVERSSQERGKQLAPIGEEDEDDDSKMEQRWLRASSRLVFGGLVGCIDPLRDGVVDAVHTAQAAGVRTVMITGDHLLTAAAIGRSLGLLPSLPSGFDSTSSALPTNDEGAAAVDCGSLRPGGEYLPTAQLDVLVKSARVFARAQPRDKMQIVSSLQRQGEVCAMTGDGVNDGPALAHSDVAIAMGSGTSVAKAASEIILLDDNFATIVRAIAQGRAIYSNIQRFVVFLIGTNSAQMLFVVLAVAIGFPIPMTPLQILFINLVTDGLPALALAANPPEEGVMQQPPRAKRESIIHGKLVWLVVCHAVVLLLLLPLVHLVVLYWYAGHVLQDFFYPSDVPPETLFCPSHAGLGMEEPGAECALDAVKKSRTAVFLLLALCENLRAWTVRWYSQPVWHRLGANQWLALASALSLVLLILVMFVPALQSLFDTTTLPWFAWLLVLCCVVVSGFCDELTKAVVFRASSQGTRALITATCNQSDEDRDGVAIPMQS